MFKYFGDNFLIRDCVEIANDIVHNSELFHEKICDATFDMATCGGDEIYNDIKIRLKRPSRIDSRSPMVKNYELTVKLYKSKNPWSSAYGYFSPSKPDHIFLNSRKLNRSRGSIVSSLIHEMIHYVDDKNKYESYGHGDNSPVGKSNTAPYWIDNLAESIVDDKQPNYNNLENVNIKVYVPWFKKIINIIKWWWNVQSKRRIKR